MTRISFDAVLKHVSQSSLAPGTPGERAGVRGRLHRAQERTSRAGPRSTNHRPGFTFMEILFSVMILGIGFIMVAAMFPAALKQTQGNVEDNEFNVLCRTAAQTMQNLAYATDRVYIANMPASTTPTATAPPRLLDRLTGWVINDLAIAVDADPATPIPSGQLVGRPIPFSFHDTRFGNSLIGTTYAVTFMPDGTTPEYQGGTLVNAMWNLVRGNMIISDKREDGWVALWSRGQKLISSKRVADPSLNLFIFPVRSRAKPQYDPYASIQGTSPAAGNPSCDVTYDPANLDPAIITFNYYPPAAGSNSNGVFEVVKLRYGAGATTEQALYGGNGAVASANPVTDNCYVIISDLLNQAGGTNPGKYNGTIFKIASEVADATGKTGTSNGEFWSVAQVINLPSEQPYNIHSPSDIGANDLNHGQGSQIEALVIGRQPDPADAIQQSDSQRKTNSKPLNRTGPTQELGYFPWSVVVQ